MLTAEVKKERERILAYLREEMITNQPGFALLAVWCPSYPVDWDQVAGTDGKAIYFGHKFFSDEFNTKERITIIVHEILHIVFRHVPRFKKIAQELKQLLNIAEDAIINYGIENAHSKSELKLPKECVTFESLLKDDPIRYQIRDADWESELLLEYLIEHKAKFISVAGGIGDPLGGDLKPDRSDMNAEGIQLPQEIEDLHAEPEEYQQDFWAKKFEAAKQGDRAGGLLRQLDKVFPKAKADWRKQLRTYAVQLLNPKRQLNHQRFSRRQLSTASPIFMPGWKKTEAVNVIAVIIDTSGSIDEKLLHQFLAEVDNIQRLTSAELILIYADAEVAAKYTVPRTTTSLIDEVKKNKYQAAGGGGTDFRPALADLENEKRKIDVAVYLTDMYGDFPDAAPRKFPVIWASISEGMSAPFGKTIYIN